MIIILLIIVLLNVYQILILIVKLISIFGDVDPADETAIRTTLQNLQTEVYSKGRYDLYDSKATSGFPRRAKKLNLTSINNFLAAGGKAYYSEMYMYDEYELGYITFDLVLIKGSTVCITTVHSNQETNERITCDAIKDHLVPLGYTRRIDYSKEYKAENNYDYVY